jgi:Ca-activated chloride channel family protein
MLSRLSTALLIVALAFPGAGESRQKMEAAAPPQPAQDILLTVTVTDKQGHAVRNISKDAFTVHEEKKPQEITSFAQNDEPLSLGILFDLSGSMRDRKKNLQSIIKENLMSFAQQSNPSNEYFIMVFTEQVRLLLDWTRDPGQIEQTLSNFQMPERGATALYDACITAIEKIKQGANQKRVLLVVTDGQDSSSKQTYRYLRELVKRSEVLTYCIHLSDPITDALSGYGKEILEELSKITGGATYSPFDRNDMRKVFELLATELRSQYRIGYRPTSNVADGKWRSVKVKVSAIEVEDLSKPARPRKKMELTARTRDGYYTVKNIK